MKKLLSLPPNLVECFHEVTGLDKDEWFCTNDPVGKKLGSGGGTTWLLKAAYENRQDNESFDEWLASERRILLHAGGQSRRLPSYAPSGKILTPIPIFRWERGQKLSQNLLSLQIPFYQHIMENAPESLHTMVVSGDVYIRTTEQLQDIPEADVVCYGLWLGPEIAKNHGVFVTDRKTPTQLKCMLQKPSVETLSELLNNHLYMTDIGVWLLSDRAVKVLMDKSTDNEGIRNYDLYGEFGCALGTHATMCDDDVNALTVAVLPLPGGEFYHYGTSREILSSTLAVQNLVNDQRQIMHRDRKPHPSIFVQNSVMETRPTSENRNLWIENSHIGSQWTFTSENIVTGVPANNWDILLAKGQCVDIVPIGEKDLWAVRPYGYDDKFRGDIHEDTSTYLGMPFRRWAEIHGVDVDEIVNGGDLQAARIFPLLDNVSQIGKVLSWMLGNVQDDVALEIWRQTELVSADDISTMASLRRLTAQRNSYRVTDWRLLAENHRHSVFYQTDLQEAAKEFAANDLPLSEPLTDIDAVGVRMSDMMFRSEVCRLKGDKEKEFEYNSKAFSLLRETLTSSAKNERQNPRLSVYSDQIVWGRSPVRIDIAGGWTDTPPYCLAEGGNVINLAIELNGQPPLQAYVKSRKEHDIVLRSIDLGASELISTYDELIDFSHVGSPFSIPKAALALAGFHPDYSVLEYDTLERQLEAFGSGIEVTLLSAVPAGSGLGTSSLLASTVLGAVSDFCGLGWDRSMIGMRTLMLEQLLTTGGGWQDQYGGVLPGVKLLQTRGVMDQTPTVRWLPDNLFTQPEYRPCHLLYYTGITRTAKTILAEIVRRMFLNNGDELALLRNMKRHTMDMYDAIQLGDFNRMGHLVRKTWQQNQALDNGTNPSEVQRLTSLIDDLCLGYKLPGAGGGGYLYMVAKDSEAAARIKRVLTDNAANGTARFVDMELSSKGLQVSRS